MLKHSRVLIPRLFAAGLLLNIYCTSAVTVTMARHIPEGQRVDRSRTVQIEACNELMEPAAFAPHFGPYFPEISDLAQEAKRLSVERGIVAFADADIFTYIRREQPNFPYRGAREMCNVVRGYPV